LKYCDEEGRRSVGLIVLRRVKEDRNSLRKVKRRMVNWMDHILRMNSLLKDVIEGTIEGRIEVTGRREGRRRNWMT
jgi:hypothetical protein